MIKNLPNNFKCNIAIIGLGYVGLPLAIEFANKSICERTKQKINNKVIGFDLNKTRINELKMGIDKTKEVDSEILKNSKSLSFTYDDKKLFSADVFIVTVPTPIDDHKRPNLNALKLATKKIGLALKKRLDKRLQNKEYYSPVVIYESTVYPGTTEEICIPILEHESGLKFNNPKKDRSFFCGYSPERINPSDRIHTLTKITKVTSGGDIESANWIDALYGSIIKAGTFKAKSIKIAEAAKVIENTQRDLNIALVNEFSIIFNKMKIDTKDVLDTAGTKWNFLKFKPGLVGGHCISVDPYYLTFKSEQLGYYPELVLAGRKINDQMGKLVAENLLKELYAKNIMAKKKIKILILGFTFKENCVDIRNTKVIDIIRELSDYKIECDVVDPWVNRDEVYQIYKLNIANKLKFNTKYSAVLLAVGHKDFADIKLNQWKSLILKDGIFYDLKDIIPRSLNPIRI